MKKKNYSARSNKYSVRRTNYQTNMRRCCVPGCFVQDKFPNKLHRIPMPNTSLAKRWFKMCPFLLKYSWRQIENTKICRNHFIHEHIDYEKGRLTKDAIPLLNLPPLKTNGKENKGKKFLEISPIHPNVPANVKVLNSAQESTFKCPSTETNKKWQVRYLVHLKAQDSHGLPVDHNMYCLPFPEFERHACLFSPCVMCQTPTKELLSSDCTNLSNEAGQQLGAPVDHNMNYGIPHQDIDAACSPVKDKYSAEPWSHSEYRKLTESVAKETIGYLDGQLWRPTKEEVKRGKLSVATQTDDSQEVSVQELGVGAVLLDSQSVQNYKNLHNVYVPPIVKDGLQTGHQEQTIYFSPSNFNLLISTPPHQTLESIHALVSGVKEHNLPFNHESSPKHNFSTEHPCTELNIQSPVIKPSASVAQTLQSRPAQKRTLESLVAELTESVSAEKLADVQPASVVMAADTTVSPPNFTFDVAPCPPTVHPTTNTLYPSASTTEIKRFRLNKENSTPQEQWLYKQLSILRTKLKVEKQKSKRLKLKLQNLRTKTKPYLKGYPMLTSEAKAFIDTQLRLAGIRPHAARYNDEEKLFALKLHQISPDCYRFLQTYIKLPQRTTLNSFMKIA